VRARLTGHAVVLKHRALWPRFIWRAWTVFHATVRSDMMTAMLKIEDGKTVADPSGCGSGVMLIAAAKVNPRARFMASTSTSAAQRCVCSIWRFVSCRDRRPPSKALRTNTEHRSARSKGPVQKRENVRGRFEVVATGLFYRPVGHGA
jgi:hypothetical protein